VQLKHLYHTTKPGIVTGNLLNALTGFSLAAALNPAGFDLWMLLALLLGLGLVVASGCVLNNWIDRDIDALMQRTQKRATVSGELGGVAALSFGFVLGALGFMVLAASFTPAVTLTALAGWLIYTGAYSLHFKRASVHGTLIGSFSGAAPALAGFLALAEPDFGALLLFGAYVLWQMPHSYAIAIFRGADYGAAKLPVLPLVRSFAGTRRQMLIYALGFTALVLALPILGYAGWVFALPVALSCLWWLRTLLTPAERIQTLEQRNKWGQQVFIGSIWCVLAMTLGAALQLALVLLSV